MHIFDNNIKKGNNYRGDSALAAKAGFWYICGNFVGKSITFITTPIFARVMSVSDYGEFSNFASWAAILIIIVGAELYNTLNRAYYDFKEEFDDYISTVTILGCLITLIAYIIFLFYHEFILKIVLIPERYVHLLFAFLLFSFCKLMYYARERTFYRYKTVAVITSLSLFVPTVISILLVYFLPVGSQLSARLYGYYVPSALIGLYCVTSLFHKRITFKWQYCRYALFLSIPLLVHNLTAYLLTSTNAMVAKNILGNEATAVISIAGSTTHLLTVFFQATSGALTTWLMDNLELGREEKAQKGISFYVVLLSVITIAVIMLSPELIYILGGQKYVAGISLLPGLVFASFVQSITTIFSIILTYDKNVVKAALYTSIFALLSIIAKVLLLPVYGLLALVYVNIVAFVALFFINYFLIKRAGYANVIFLKGIIVTIILTGGCAVLSPLLYEWQSLRYLLTGMFLAGCIMIIVFKRNIITKLVNKRET